MTSIRCPLYEASLISQHEPGLVQEERTFLFFEFNELVSYTAWHLQKAGCKPGDRIGLYLTQDWRYVVLLLAIIRLGAVACPLNTRLPSATALAQLKAIGSNRVIAHVEPARRAQLKEFDVLDPVLLTEIRAGSQPLEWDHKVDMDRPATILFTSGSSGAPKAAVLTYANHYYSARGSNANIKVASRDRWLLSLPLYHVGGLGILFRCLLAGATIAVPNPGESVTEARKRMGATHLSLVSTQLLRLLRDEDTRRFTDIKAVLLGGSAIPPMLLQEARERSLPVYPSYGLTEMASQVTTMSPTSPPTKRHTSGMALANREVSLARDGEIRVRGKTLFAGYVDGDNIVRPVDREGWFLTGDLGRMDDEGYLDVVGRKDNLFISGGENIQPEEIEAILVSMPGVEEAIVVPVEDAEFGERPFAFVRSAETVDAGEVRAILAKGLPAFKIPVGFAAFPDDGKDVKPSRAALRELANKIHHVS